MNRVLTVTLSPDWKSGLLAAGKAMQQGIETGEYQGEVLSFESAGVLFGKLTEKRWDLVRALLSEAAPIGVREVARRVDRGVRRVHDDIQVLIELGMIERTEDGKIACPYDDIHVDLHVRAA